MEMPQPTQQFQRKVTGEIVYLDEMRRRNQKPKQYLDLSDMAIQMYETEACFYDGDNRPDIMDEYDLHDYDPSEAVGSCTALAGELLALKEEGSRSTFVDIAVEANPDVVLERLGAIAAGSLLAGEDEQLAIPSAGEYYPVLDIRKQNSALVDVGLRVWGWDDPKIIFTNREGEQYKHPEHELVYPSDETSSTRQLELSFDYRDASAGNYSESITLHLPANGSAAISRNIWAMAYAETGYEGHDQQALDNLTDDDIAAFGHLIAEIVGDTPMSVSAKIEQRLQEIINDTVTETARQAVRSLQDATWPAQAIYLLNTRFEGEDKTLAQQLCDEETADAASEKVNMMTKRWSAKRKK